MFQDMLKEFLKYNSLKEMPQDTRNTIINNNRMLIAEMNKMRNILTSHHMYQKADEEFKRIAKMIDIPFLRRLMYEQQINIKTSNNVLIDFSIDDDDLSSEQNIILHKLIKHNDLRNLFKFIVLKKYTSKLQDIDEDTDSLSTSLQKLIAILEKKDLDYIIKCSLLENLTILSMEEVKKGGYLRGGAMSDAQKTFNNLLIVSIALYFDTDTMVVKYCKNILKKQNPDDSGNAIVSRMADIVASSYDFKVSLGPAVVSNEVDTYKKLFTETLDPIQKDFFKMINLQTLLLFKKNLIKNKKFFLPEIVFIINLSYVIEILNIKILKITENDPLNLLEAKIKSNFEGENIQDVIEKIFPKSSEEEHQRIKKKEEDELKQNEQLLRDKLLEEERKRQQELLRQKAVEENLKKGKAELEIKKNELGKPTENADIKNIQKERFIVELRIYLSQFNNYTKYKEYLLQNNFVTTEWIKTNNFIPESIAENIQGILDQLSSDIDPSHFAEKIREISIKANEYSIWYSKMKFFVEKKIREGKELLKDVEDRKKVVKLGDKVSNLPEKSAYLIIGEMVNWENVDTLPTVDNSFKSKQPSYVDEIIKKKADKLQYNIGSNTWRDLKVEPRKSRNAEQKYLMCTTDGTLNYSSFFLSNGIEVVLYNDDNEPNYYSYVDSVDKIEYKEIKKELFLPEQSPDPTRYQELLDNLKSNIEITDVKTFAKSIGYDFSIPTHFGPFSVENVDNGFQFKNGISVLFNEEKKINYRFTKNQYTTYDEAFAAYEADKAPKAAAATAAPEAAAAPAASEATAESSFLKKQGKAFIGRLKWVAGVGAGIYICTQVANYIEPGVSDKFYNAVTEQATNLASQFSGVVSAGIAQTSSYLKSLYNDNKEMDYEKPYPMFNPSIGPLPPLPHSRMSFRFGGGAQNNDKYYQKYLKYKYKYLQLK